MSSAAAARPPLDPAVLRAASPRWTVEVVERLPSTNAEVARRARAGEAAGLVLVAEHQTAGRGRLERRWETPPRAGLTFSVLLRPRVPDRRWPWLPLLAGLAVADAVRSAGGPRCELKWPNDVQHDGRKLAGLLVERVDGPTGPSTGPAAVVGIGLNVSTRRAELPVETATSLALTGMPAPDRGRLLVQVLQELGVRYDAWCDAGEPQEPLAEEYAERCATVGREVRVHLPSGDTVTGRAVGIGPDGSLVLDARRRRMSLSAGDVVHVRVP